MANDTQARVSYAYATRLSQNLAKTSEGYLLATNCVLARSGVQQYRRRSELGLEGGTDELVNVDRPVSEVTSRAFLGSLIGKALTSQHPSGGMLSPATHAQSAIGTVLAARVGEEPDSDGNVLVLGDVIVYDPTAITLIETGLQRQLSVGYVFSPYEGPDGQLEMRDLAANHLALVPRGRAGNAQIVDALPLSAAPTESYTDMMARYHRKNAKEAAPAPAPERPIFAYDNSDIAPLITEIQGGHDKIENEDTMKTKDVTKDETSDSQLARLCQLLEAFLEKMGATTAATDFSAAKPNDGCEKPSTLGTELIPVTSGGGAGNTNPVIDHLRTLRPYIQASGDRAAIDAYNDAIKAARRGNVGPAERLVSVYDRENAQGNYEAKVARLRAKLLGQPEPARRPCRVSLIADHRQSEVTFQEMCEQKREELLAKK
jgi:hypothetical protein